MRHDKSEQRRKSYSLSCQGAYCQECFQQRQGLHELAKSGAIRVPEVIRLTEDFLVLEFIPTAINPPTDFWPKLGQQLANLHAYSQKIPGFHQDNFIGRSPQKNHCNGNWKEFFWQRRLLPQWELVQNLHHYHSRGLGLHLPSWFGRNQSSS